MNLTCALYEELKKQYSYTSSLLRNDKTLTEEQTKVLLALRKQVLSMLKRFKTKKLKENHQ